jgi:D-glycero-D-manno-heptose 1,7-bisphosphate phosphatase
VQRLVAATDLTQPTLLEKQSLSLVILDRDGTLIEDTGYPIDPATLIWKHGALKMLSRLRSQGTIVTVATNQSGVARGYFSLDKVHAFHAAMDAQIKARGGRIDAYAICPHLPNGVVTQYAVDCECRKPKPGLIKQLLTQFQVAPQNAIMIGDRDRDIQAGQAAGVASFLYRGGDLFEFTKAVISSHFGMELITVKEPLTSQREVKGKLVNN